uniref:AAA+ ATPase domain-containing protein n=1 Tax=viral metagenome TaxID=1070528 RepID=A0A6C0EQV5_9ZZZZ
MLNRRKRSSIQLSPSKIDSYNKFLICMDKNAYNENKLPDKINNNAIKESNIAEESNVLNKYELDLLLEQILNNFKLNNMYSSKFTGKNLKDDYVYDSDNYYSLYYNKHFNKSSNKSTDNTKEIKKEIINIDVEINNISDILKIIEDFKLDDSVEYNIDLEALHKIKEPLKELNNMIGMKDLKMNIVDQILYFIQGLHKSKNNTGDFMHTVIYGPPGTGKTEIAKIMGKIYSKIGLLKKGTFKKVTRSDLIAGYLGQTALKTAEVIKQSIGGVLFIDEAYALGNSDKKDSFSKECIDTLCEALSDNKDDLMVIIAGYDTELKECFFNYNQGLDSRFTWRFKTEKYSGEDLYNIFLKKVNEIEWKLQEDSQIVINWFNKNIDYFKFFGRDVETFLAKTKIAHSRRVFYKPENDKKKITLDDLEKGFKMYVSNSDITNKKETENLKKYILDTMYC